MKPIAVASAIGNSANDRKLSVIATIPTTIRLACVQGRCVLSAASPGPTSATGTISSTPISWR